MIPHKLRKRFVKITQSNMIEYPEEWRGNNGPFDGAYQWALENMGPGEEIVGVKKKINHFNRIDLYRFKLIRGYNDCVKGRMDYPLVRHFYLCNGLLQLIGVGKIVEHEWVATNSASGKLCWVTTFRKNTVYRNLYNDIPTNPMLAIMELNRTIERYNTTGKSWCKAVFNCSPKQIERKYGHFIYSPVNLEEIRETYLECMDIIGTIASSDESAGRVMSMDTIEELIDIGLDLISPLDPASLAEPEEDDDDDETAPPLETEEDL